MLSPTLRPGNLVNLSGDPRQMPMPAYGANPPRPVMPGQPMPGQPMPGAPAPWGGQPPAMQPVGQPMRPMPSFGANPPRFMGATPGGNLTSMGNYGDFLRRPYMGR